MRLIVNKANADRRLLLVILVLLVTIVGLVTVVIIHSRMQSAQALSGAEFKADRIIDDSVFYNSTAMNSGDIQSFLQSQVPSCDTNGTLSAADMGRSDLTHAQYAATRGWHSPPYTCIKDYRQNTPSMSASGTYCSAMGAQTNINAAQIISNIAQACRINPQILLVLLQKEQSLVKDTWPLNGQYTSATGFGCPDTAACDPSYGGFFYQVYYAARQFQIYKKFPTSYNYVAGRNNNVYYHPGPYVNNAQQGLSYCGSSQIYIQNQATAALYTYTPYQPNQAALNNLYGTGDTCSSYGNRNFWRMFRDWFGSTLAPSFEARYRAKTENPYVNTGESTNVYLQFTNTGTSFWKDDISTFPGYFPVRIAANEPINRWSPFRDSSWISGSRPTGIFTKVYEADGSTLSPDQYTVQPGQIAEYQFKITVPLNTPGGVYREYFQPILEGAPNYSLGTSTYIDVHVVKTEYKAAYYSQSAYPTITSGEDSSPIRISYKNTGNITWYDDTSVTAGKYPIHLAATWPINRWSVFASGWSNGARPAVNFSKVYEANGSTLASNQHVVLPGQIGEFTFNIKAPIGAATGFYREDFQPIVEGAPGSTYDMGAVSWMGINVNASSVKAQYAGQSAYPTLTAGESSSKIYFDLKNSGNVPWYDDTSVTAGKYPIHLAATWPINRGSVFASGWLNSARPVINFTKVYDTNGVEKAQNNHTVLPGETARFEFDVRAPVGTAPGFYREDFQPIIEGAPGYGWNIDTAVWMGINVN